MIHRILCAGVVTACLAILPALAMAETFLMVPGVAGDAVEKNHKGWIRVETLAWETEAKTSYLRDGAAVGKPTPGPLRLALPSGPWSTAWVRAQVIGAALGGGGKLVLDHTASDGRLLYRITFDGAFVTEYALGSSASSLPNDLLEVVFRTIQIEQYFVGADGRIGSTTVGWDVPYSRLMN